jgi:beta-mannosidase
VLDGLRIEPWWPNGAGAQPLYDLSVALLAADGTPVDECVRRVGFKHVEWRACADAPAGADPWLCVVNGRPLFLQGVNWTPIRPNFADVPPADYRARVEAYRGLGANLFRVWGGSFLETELFYSLCDEAGILVWQEFPLSSSGWENWPPEDARSIAELSAIARSYIRRRQHHASLLMWCGGNELQGTIDGGKAGCGKPAPKDHPLLAAFARIVAEEDPGRRFVEASSSGPRFCADAKEFGQGLHWDIHGPWKMERTVAEWQEYWEREDSLFRSETGSPGASPVDVIEAACSGLPAVPGTMDNPLWRRNKWWIEWPGFVAEHGREPAALAEYVAWSQARQRLALTTALRIYKAKFPRCGGMIFWMGHDCFPCPANTSILDVHGRPKPAALGIGELWCTPPEALRAPPAASNR